MAPRFANVEDLPDAVPVFPLLGAMLLPRSVLPLHIFEPRYLAMVDAALSGTRMIGIIQPEGEGGPTGSPLARSAPLRRVGCIGRITSFQEVDGGRYMIVLTGVARFTPAGETATDLPFRSFRIDATAFADDLVTGHGEDDVDRDKLLDVFKRYLAARQMTTDWQAIAKSPSETLVNALSMAGPFAPSEKQALLEASSLKERARVLITLAEMALAAGGESGPETRM
jgi:Lon protease-like protein